MEQEYINGDIVMYDNKIHTIMDTLGINNYELSYISHPVHQLELSGVPIIPEILEKNGWEKDEEASFKTQLYYRKKVGVRTIFVIIKEETSRVIYDSTCLRIIQYCHELQHLLFGLGLNSEMEALEVIVLDKDEYNTLIDNQADEDELEYLKACQYALESFNRVRGLCPKCKKSVVIDGWVCCGYDSSGEELYKYGD